MREQPEKPPFRRFGCLDQFGVDWNIDDFSDPEMWPDQPWCERQTGMRSRTGWRAVNQTGSAFQSLSHIDPDLKMAIGMGCLKLDDERGCSRWIEVENLDRTHSQLCKGMGKRDTRPAGTPTHYVLKRHIGQSATKALRTAPPVRVVTEAKAVSENYGVDGLLLTCERPVSRFC
ncbi:hypothetical protein [Rhizobium sp. C4]|uniref:hypothetical protein n=1 Tax=Rhizobium sp. C4 TaxID=1349800 RepID=UPI001E51BCA1|nr:hypothetical protein [Rhizobium sp. C4]MCD2175122.1 hypothetical protein [Rhizobium sp. C4]